MNLQHREIENRFEAWWRNESEQLLDGFGAPVSAIDFLWVKKIAEVAWSNGAYCAIHKQSGQRESKKISLLEFTVSKVQALNWPDTVGEYKLMGPANNLGAWRWYEFQLKDTVSRMKVNCFLEPIDVKYVKRQAHQERGE